MVGQQVSVTIQVLDGTPDRKTSKFSRLRHQGQVSVSFDLLLLSVTTSTLDLCQTIPRERTIPSD